jgi:hypothetical protein
MSVTKKRRNLKKEKKRKRRANKFNNTRTTVRMNRLQNLNLLLEQNENT